MPGNFSFFPFFLKVFIPFGLFGYNLIRILSQLDNRHSNPFHTKANFEKVLMQSQAFIFSNDLKSQSIKIFLPAG